VSESFDELPESVGRIVHGEPFQISSDDLQLFERATWLDKAYPDEIAEFPDTLVEGFMLLSLLDPILRMAVGESARVQWGLNYGLDRVRFVSPIHVGDTVLSRFETVEVQPKDLGFKVLRHCELTVEGQDHPAMVADWWGFVLPRGILERERRDDAVE